MTERPHEGRYGSEGAARVGAVFHAECDYVARTLRRLGIREADLEDLTHDVFVTFHRKLHQYDPSRPVRPWLFGIAFRLASEHRRRAVRRTAILWAVLAFVAWNAVFDRIIVISGRRYIRDAVEADARGAYLLLNDSMRPAVVQAFWGATAVGSVVAAAGVLAVRRRKRKFA